MFKQRLIGALAYLIALTLLLGLFSAGCLTGYVIVTALLSVPEVGAIVKSRSHYRSGLHGNRVTHRIS